MRQVQASRMAQPVPLLPVSQSSPVHSPGVWRKGRVTTVRASQETEAPFAPIPEGPLSRLPQGRSAP
ncbi:hypothetical protein OCAR_4264 [Afipia carboxidovorans OM5]|nr:hypothetical protein OCAR_4264 [Afipia carboxidovorans OM5]